METQKGPYKDYSPSRMGLYMGFHVSLGECNNYKKSMSLWPWPTPAQAGQPLLWQPGPHPPPTLVKPHQGGLGAYEP